MRIFLGFRVQGVVGLGVSEDYLGLRVQGVVGLGRA